MAPALPIHQTSFASVTAQGDSAIKLGVNPIYLAITPAHPHAAPEQAPAGCSAGGRQALAAPTHA
jgi:hypothetical protein